MKDCLLIILWMMALVSCDQRGGGTKEYFDIDSLVDRQIMALLDANASVTKTASVDSTRDRSTFTPDSAGWATELAVFRQLEVFNKPIYAESYQRLNGVEDRNSNLRITVFRATQSIPVREFKIFYQGVPAKIRKIEADIRERNALYFSARKLILELEDYEGRAILSRYRIEGVQKMILTDSVRFSISSTVNY